MTRGGTEVDGSGRLVRGTGASPLQAAKSTTRFQGEILRWKVNALEPLETDGGPI